MGSWHHFFFNTIDGINNKLWCTDKQPKHFYQTLHRTSALLREWNQQGEGRCLLPTRPLVTVHLSHSHEDSPTHVGPQHYPSQDFVSKEWKMEVSEQMYSLTREWPETVTAGLKYPQFWPEECLDFTIIKGLCSMVPATTYVYPEVFKES